MVKRRQGKQKTRWRDEIGSFIGVTWNRLIEMSGEDWWRLLSCSGLKEAAAAAAADNDGDDADDDDSIAARCQCQR